MDRNSDEAVHRPSTLRRSPTARCVVAAVAICWVLSLSDRCEARADDLNYQGWINVSAVAPLAARTELKLDGLLQRSVDDSRASRQFVRGVVRTRVDDRWMVGGGAVWTHVRNGEATFTERRVVQEADFTQPVAWRGSVFSSRTQLEERFRSSQHGMSLRMRQLTRMEVPISKPGLAVVAWNEYFHELRSTAWAGGAGPGAAINFLGVRVPVSPQVSVEPGYLIQTTFQPGRNPVTRAAAIYLTFRR